MAASGHVSARNPARLREHVGPSGHVRGLTPFVTELRRKRDAGETRGVADSAEGAQAAHRLGARLGDLVDRQLAAALERGDAQIEHSVLDLPVLAEKIGHEASGRRARDQGVHAPALSELDKAACRVVAPVGAGEAGLDALRNTIVRGRRIPRERRINPLVEAHRCRLRSICRMSTRERVEKNERLFRDLNERIRDVSESLLEDGEPVEFICECAHEGCLDRVKLTRELFAEVRDDATWFFVVPGHEREDVEVVVERREGYVIVAKPWLA